MRVTDFSDAALRAGQRHRRDQLAAAFEIDIADVIADAEMVRGWSGPWDDALAAICRAHAWQAEMGVVYLAHLKRVLDPAAGPLPSAWLSD